MDWEKLKKDISFIVADHYITDSDFFGQDYNTQLTYEKVNMVLDEVLNDIWEYCNYQEKNK